MVFFIENQVLMLYQWYTINRLTTITVHENIIGAPKNQNNNDASF